MLILARRPGERVVIGDEILVTVMEVSASTVRLGIEAPRGVSIFREEIWLAVKEENRAAAAADLNALPIHGGELPGLTDAPPAQADPSPSQADELPSQADKLPPKPVDDAETDPEG
jgi:carbon storage regulator